MVTAFTRYFFVMSVFLFFIEIDCLASKVQKQEWVSSSAALFEFYGARDYAPQLSYLGSDCFAACVFVD